MRDYLQELFGKKFKSLDYKEKLLKLYKKK